jgi:hypothetical protein
MTDEQLTRQLETIVSEMALKRESYSAFIRTYLDRERIASLAVASGQYNLLKSKEARTFAETISKPTVREKELIVEMEIGEIAFQKAVIDAELKMMEKEAKTLETLCFHTASLRKAERV